MHRMATTLCFAAIGLCAASAAAFTQKSVITPIGHEWLTVEGANRVKTDFPFLAPKDSEVTSANASCVLCDDYGTNSHAVWSTVMGQRWVDIMGFLVGKAFVRSDSMKCFDAVPQMANELQYDHFTRQRCDEGDDGRLTALKSSIAAFRRHFLAAVKAPDEPMGFRDGGAVSGSYKAIRSYFLFGRALHLFQDSFSTEHSVRDASTDFRTVIDIKAYLCAKGSPLHKHVVPGVVSGAVGAVVETIKGALATGVNAAKAALVAVTAAAAGSEVKPVAPRAELSSESIVNAARQSYADHGDVIWKNAFGSNTQDNLKDHAKAALLATSELWRAFLLARGPRKMFGGLESVLPQKTTKKTPEQLVDAIIKRWFSFDPGKGKGAKPATEAELASCNEGVRPQKVYEYHRQQCLSATGRGEDSIMPPFDWSVSNSGALANTTNTLPTITDPSDEGAAGCVKPDPHFVLDSEYFVPDQAFSGTEITAFLSQRLPFPGSGPRKFIKTLDGDPIQSNLYWKTRPATREDLKVGKPIVFASIAENDLNRAPRNRDEARGNMWFIANVTDVSELGKGYVATNRSKVLADSARVPMTAKVGDICSEEVPCEEGSCTSLAGPLRCIPTPVAKTAKAGEKCDANTTCEDSSCLPDGALGTFKCAAAETPPTKTNAALGEQCDVNTTCDEGVCLPAGTSTLRCTGTRPAAPPPPAVAKKTAKLGEACDTSTTCENSRCLPDGFSAFKCGAAPSGAVGAPAKLGSGVPCTSDSQCEKKCKQGAVTSNCE